MNRKIFVTLAVLILLVLGVSSCEHAFPNDDLDFYWRLQTIEYASGKTEQVKGDVMFGFARHMVLIEDLSNNFSRHGVTTDTGDSLKLDFSMYPASETDAILEGLGKCGMDSLVTTFKVDYPKDRLVLTSGKATLRFKKW
jgi:hypothetical protein